MVSVSLFHFFGGGKGEISGHLFLCSCYRHLKVDIGGGSLEKTGHFCSRFSGPSTVWDTLGSPDSPSFSCQMKLQKGGEQTFLDPLPVTWGLYWGPWWPFFISPFHLGWGISQEQQCCLSCLCGWLLGESTLLGLFQDKHQRCYCIEI